MCDKVINTHQYALEDKVGDCFLATNESKSSEIITAFSVDPSKGVDGNEFILYTQHALDKKKYDLSFAPANGYCFTDEALNRYEKGDERLDLLEYGPQYYLDGITPAPRGIPQIEVTFDIDANGILNVSAKDKATGKEQKIRIEASSGLSEDEIKRMRDEAKANEAADKAERERVDKINAADTLCFQSEKNLKEYGDKIPSDKKGTIEAALGSLKEAVKSQNVSDIERYTEQLNNAWHAASEDIAKAAQGGQQAGPQGPQSGPQNQGPDDQGPDEQ